MHRPSTSVVICVVIAAATGCGRLSRHPVAVAATEEVRQNRRVADALGQPVVCDGDVRGMANETDGIASLQFDARGPKGTGLIVVEGKKTGGEWGVTLLELRPAGQAPRVSLTADLEARTGTDTPAFDPAGAARATPPAPPPPTEIEITLPPGPPGQ